MSPRTSEQKKAERTEIQRLRSLRKRAFITYVIKGETKRREVRYDRSHLSKIHIPNRFTAEGNSNTSQFRKVREF